MVGGLRGLEGRTGRLGRHLPRLRGRRGDRAPLRESVAAFADAVAPDCSLRRRSDGSATGGTRALREADRRRLGPRDRPRAPAAGVRRLRDVHPTFLYEGLGPVRGGRPFSTASSGSARRRFSLYVALYCAFRYEETLRIDSSHHFAGQRLNFWVALVLLVLSAAFFLWWQIIGPWRRRRRAGRGSNQVVAGRRWRSREACPILSLASEA